MKSGGMPVDALISKLIKEGAISATQAEEFKKKLRKDFTFEEFTKAIRCGGVISVGKDQQCPLCTHTLNAATSTEGHTPSPGDLSMCAYCLTFLQFGEDMSYEALSDEELNNLPGLDEESKTQLYESRKFFGKRPLVDQA